MAYQVTRTDEQWRSELSGDEYAVLREAATERPWTASCWTRRGWAPTGAGHAARCCSGRDQVRLARGWPSFYRPAEGDAVELVEDRTLGMVRTEVRCARCGSHLGHVFDDAPQTPTGDRFCMNSVSLTFDADD